jgi:predicted dehydrogenase
MSGKELGVAVVGCGFWANEMHLPALARIPGVRVVGVASASAESAKRTAERFGVERWTTDHRELLADGDVDAIDILTPNHLHRSMAIDAAKAGKHAICIKPMALSVAEADEMIAAAKRHGTRLLYAENVPFIPSVERARQLVDDGAVGEVFRVKACEGIGGPHADWLLDPARSGGGALLDMAVHSISFCRYLAGDEVATVYAEAGTFVHAGRITAEDTVALTLRFAGGAIGQCEDSWSLVGAMDSRFEVYGTTGRILIDNLHRQPLQVMSAPGGGDGGWSYPLPIAGDIADGHLAMLTHFVECLRSGTPSRSEAQEGRAILAIAEAAQRSMRSGRKEEVQP